MCRRMNGLPKWFHNDRRAYQIQCGGSFCGPDGTIEKDNSYLNAFDMLGELKSDDLTSHSDSGMFRYTEETETELLRVQGNIQIT